MKIEQGNITITEIPVFERIEVTPHEFLLSLEGLPCGYSREDITVLRDALTAALDAQARMNGTPASILPGVFNAGDAEPGPEVNTLRDVDGSDWYRGREGWSLRRGGYEDAWSAILQYAPLTDVTND